MIPLKANLCKQRMVKMSKTVVVTGSARGIGKAIAIKFAQSGYTVVLNTKKSLNALKDTLDEVKKYSPSSISYAADISVYDKAEQMFEHIEKTVGKVDVLVNNAGVSVIGLFDAMKPAEWQELMRNNVDSVFNCTHLVLPQMLHRHSGRIINISSMWGISGASCEVAYSASKGAVNAFTKALAREVGPSGIYVNAIACGAMETQMNSFMSEEEHNAFAEEIPLCRFGRPDEAASLALYLAEENSYITGQIISLDGGIE